MGAEAADKAVFDAFKKLREPFPPALIGHLPRGGVQLDFVGHAATTDRLLQADPQWTWTPLGTNDDGSPKLVTDKSCFSDTTAKVGLWINLHIAGTTTPGFGEGKNVKEAISDALRNAAMRRGVALDLWSKQDLDGGSNGSATTAQPQAAPPKPAESTEPLASAAEQKKLDRLITNLATADASKDWASIADKYIQREFQHGRDQLTKAELPKVVTALETYLGTLGTEVLREAVTA